MTGRKKCGRCGNDGAVRSRRRPFERLLSLLGVFPFRCRTCNARFYAPGRV